MAQTKKTNDASTYQAALDMYWAGKYNQEKLIQDLIKTRPELFIELAQKEDVLNIANINALITKTIRAGELGGYNIVECIKAVRAYSGLGLKDAKAHVDNYKLQRGL